MSRLRGEMRLCDLSRSGSERLETRGERHATGERREVTPWNGSRRVKICLILSRAVLSWLAREVTRTALACDEVYG